MIRNLGREAAGRLALLAGTAIAFAVPMEASAQDAGAQPPPTQMLASVSGDIVVTARRREESALSAPVVLQGLNQEQLEARGISSLTEFSQTIPSLVIAEAAGASQGGAISLRGISAGDGNPFGDQAVAFNIDGVQVARSSVRRMSEMDLQQIEVLKGPQALYYGKNSPGGVVVIRTADPGDTLEVGVKVGYEFNARELTAEGFISTPLTEALGIRIAGYSSNMRGWVTNEATPSSTMGPQDKWLPHTSEYAGRMTLKYDDGGPWTARLKVAHGVVKGRGAGATAQRVHCPYGAPHHGTALENGVLVPALIGGADDCRVDDRMVRADIPTSFNALWPLIGDGVPSLRQTQTIAGLEMDLEIGPSLILSSTTGYYKSKYHTLENFAAADTLFPTVAWASDVYLNMREISQELRLTSDLDGPVNFMVGGYYQDSELSNAQISVFNELSPTYPFIPNRSTLDGKAWSVFGSVSIKPVETLEISGGGRISKEIKNYAVYSLLNPDGSPDASMVGQIYDPTLPGGTAVSRRSFDDFSPELTIAWRPTQRFTLFGSYRTGFLSGGFQTGSGNLALDQSYDPQDIEGFEAGAKGLFFNDSLRANLALYTYKITNQQVTITEGPTQITSNAASSRSKGVELDFNWTAPVQGLSLRGGVTYNKARYLHYENAVCYGGQTIALGCLPVNGGFAQDLSGQPIPRAPDWGGFAGGSFEIEDGGGRTWGFSVDANYRDGSFAEATNKPGSYQSSYWLLDASAFVRSGPAELRVLGRNLTNTYYFARTIDGIFTGATLPDRSQGVLVDTIGSVSRGREIMVQLKYNFGGN